MLGANLPFNSCIKHNNCHVCLNNANLNLKDAIKVIKKKLSW